MDAHFIKRFSDWISEGSEIVVNIKKKNANNKESEELFNSILEISVSHKNDNEDITDQDLIDMLKAFLIRSAEYLQEEQT